MPRDGLFERVHYVHTADNHRLALTELRNDREPDEDAPVFLLLHGFGQNRLAFLLGDLPATLLDRGARVFAGELRGHGRSQVYGRVRAWTLETLLQHDYPTLIGHVLALTKATRLHLMAHSMGGILGYALLENEPRLASLTTLGAALEPRAGRLLARAAAAAFGPVVAALRPRRVPVDLLLAALAPALSEPKPWTFERLLQRFVRLTNPALAKPEHLRLILLSADPEAPSVFVQLALMKMKRRPRIGSIDLLDAVKKSPLPIAAIIGTSDIFAPTSTVRSLREPGHLGPRRIIEIPDGTHVDLTMGNHVPETVAELWDFLVDAEP